jgi:hypothetical protein
MGGNEANNSILESRDIMKGHESFIVTTEIDFYIERGIRPRIHISMHPLTRVVASVELVNEDQSYIDSV